MGSYASTFKGYINEQGILRCKMSALGGYGLFGKDTYASQFEGRIDCLGNVSFSSSALGRGYYRNLPTTFRGVIGASGYLFVESEVISADYLGMMHVSEIVGEPFIAHQQAITMFVENRRKLHALLDTFRAK